MGAAAQDAGALAVVEVVVMIVELSLRSEGMLSILLIRKGPCGKGEGLLGAKGSLSLCNESRKEKRISVLP
jgi:hypothetical protein